jgi:hypothetical protein
VCPPPSPWLSFIFADLTLIDLKVVIVCAAIGFKLYRMALVEPPMGSILEEWIQSCAYSKTNPFHDFICIVEPFFEELLSNEIGKSFITAFGASGTVCSSGLHCI